MLQGCDASFPRNMGGLGPHIRASRHAPPVDPEWAKETDDDCGRYSLSLLFPCASFYYSLVSTSGGIMKFSSNFFFLEAIPSMCAMNLCDGAWRVAVVYIASTLTLRVVQAPVHVDHEENRLP